MNRAQQAQLRHAGLYTCRVGSRVKKEPWLRRSIGQYNRMGGASLVCGIAGFVNRSGLQADRAIVERMTATLTHRGPDGDGIYVNGQVALGHRRLSIIDVAGGSQPMSNEDGSSGSAITVNCITTRNCGRSWKANCIAIGPRATPRLWFTSMKRRARSSSAGSTGCLRWRFGTAAGAGWCSRGTAWARNRFTTLLFPAGDSRLARSPKPFWHIRRSAGPSIVRAWCATSFTNMSPLPLRFGDRSASLRAAMC